MLDYHLSDRTTDGIGLVCVGHHTANWIDVDQIDLDRSVILGVDDSVAS